MPQQVETTPTPAEALRQAQGLDPATAGETAVTPQPTDGAQPPIEQATPVAPQDEQTKEERARALLQGEPPKDLAPDLSEQASIDAQFDPETGELLEEDPLPQSQGEQPAAAEGENAPAQTPEADAEEDEEEPDGGDRKARRIRVKRDALSDRDFAILTLAKDKKITFAEAEQQLFGKTAPKEEPAQSDRTAQQQQPTAQQISKRINELRAQRDAAGETIDVRRVNAINDELIELRELLTDVRRAEASQAQAARQTAAQQYVTAETAAIERATDIYPDADIEGTRLNAAMQAKAASLRTEDPRFFHNPKWPILLAVETATDLGIAAKVKGQAASPAQKATPMTAPKKTTRLAPTPAPGTATGSQTNTEAKLREELNTAKANRDVEGIKAVMRKLTP